MPSAGDLVPYSTQVGLIYVFNLIIGTGALALPRAFQDAGYVLATLVLIICAFTSYVSATFIIEAMGATNAVLEYLRMRSLKRLAVEAVSRKGSGGAETYPNSSWGSEHDEMRPLVRTRSSIALSIHGKQQIFDIGKRYELSEMATVFLGKWGVIFFYLSLVVYLYGDLAIYAAVVPKSLMSVICSSNLTQNSTEYNDPCMKNGPEFLTRYTMYRLFTVCFALLISPFVFTGMTKTKYLQLFTSASRWIAFGSMLVLAMVRIFKKENHDRRMMPVNFKNFGDAFGISVYAFMCHHSLPSLVTPMRRKSRIFGLFILVYILVLLFYSFLSFTSVLAFSRVEDVYTLNFFQPGTFVGHSLTFTEFVSYFLGLFPVFTLSTNFPIVGVTLRRNLSALFFGTKSNESRRVSRSQSHTSLVSLDRSDSVPTSSIDNDTLLVEPETSNRLTFLIMHVAIPLLVLIPPFCVAVATDRVEVLASITGSYAGVCVQYVMPSLLVIALRSKVTLLLGDAQPRSSQSPFRSRYWPYLLLAWSAFAVVIVTINHIMQATSS